jgi:hypothetical protein
LRANADSTPAVTGASAIKTLMPASEVVSAFARRGAKADLRVTQIVGQALQPDNSAGIEVRKIGRNFPALVSEGVELKV